MLNSLLIGLHLIFGLDTLMGVILLSASFKDSRQQLSFMQKAAIGLPVNS